MVERSKLWSPQDFRGDRMISCPISILAGHKVEWVSVGSVSCCSARKSVGSSADPFKILEFNLDSSRKTADGYENKAIHRNYYQIRNLFLYLINHFVSQIGLDQDRPGSLVSHLIQEIVLRIWRNKRIKSDEVRTNRHRPVSRRVVHAFPDAIRHLLHTETQSARSL
jgi:hypothetical protein